jgi:hypothetical protein
LDISLDYEIGRENYKNIKSLSEFDAFDQEIERKNSEAFKNPVLFKIHGTISYPRTIRATIETVKNFEHDKLRVIRWVLCHTRILIIVGYSFSDEDFRDAFYKSLIEKALKDDHFDSIDIYWVHANPKNEEKYRGVLDTIAKKKIFKKIIKSRHFIAKSADIFFEELTEEIEKNDRERKIPTAARQKIRNLIMEYTDKDDQKKISESKFFIEVIIFALTVKGLFSLEALTDYIRVRKYCSELLSDKNKSTPNELLERLVEKGLIQELDNHCNIYYLPEADLDKIANQIIELFSLTKIKAESKMELEKQLYVFS